MIAFALFAIAIALMCVAGAIHIVGRILAAEIRNASNVYSLTSAAERMANGAGTRLPSTLERATPIPKRPGSKQKGDSAAELIVCIGLLAILFAGWYGFARASCDAKWEKSGLKSSFSVLQGCQVEVSPGRWLPDSTIREIDIAPQKGGSK